MHTYLLFILDFYEENKTREDPELLHGQDESEASASEASCGSIEGSDSEICIGNNGSCDEFNIEVIKLLSSTFKI